MLCDFVKRDDFSTYVQKNILALLNKKEKKGNMRKSWWFNNIHKRRKYHEKEKNYFRAIGSFDVSRNVIEFICRFWNDKWNEGQYFISRNKWKWSIWFCQVDFIKWRWIFIKGWSSNYCSTKYPCFYIGRNWIFWKKCVPIGELYWYLWFIWKFICLYSSTEWYEWNGNWIYYYRCFKRWL